jgi:small subunit ribosomal protein S7
MRIAECGLRIERSAFKKGSFFDPHFAIRNPYSLRFCMPRKAHIVRREIVPDPVYQSTLVSKFVNCMMLGGKKSTAQLILYHALSIVQQKSNDDPMKLFKKAVENVKPVLEVKSRRVGGSTYQVPVEVGPARRTSLSIRWILAYSRSRGEKSMEEKLAGEVMDAANNRGNSIKKKEDTHRMAEANKAFAHYRW